VVWFFLSLNHARQLIKITKNVNSRKTCFEVFNTRKQSISDFSLISCCVGPCNMILVLRRTTRPGAFVRVFYGRYECDAAFSRQDGRNVAATVNRNRTGDRVVNVPTLEMATPSRASQFAVTGPGNPVFTRPSVRLAYVTSASRRPGTIRIEFVVHVRTVFDNNKNGSTRTRGVCVTWRLLCALSYTNRRPNNV